MRKQRFDYESRFDMEFDGLQCERTRTEQGYTLVFIRDPLPTVKDKGRFYIKMQMRIRTFAEVGFCVKYRGEKDIFFGQYEKCYQAVGERLFAKKRWTNCVRYDGKKIICNHVSNRLALFILAYLRLECISEKARNSDLDPEYCYSLYEKAWNNKTVLRGLITGRITNNTQFLKEYIAQAYKIKNFNFDKVAGYFRSRSYGNPRISLNKLIAYTTSYEKAIDRINGFNDNNRKDEFNLFCDLIEDAYLLDKKINPKWSLRRMQEEHLKNTDEIALRNEMALSDDALYDNDDLTVQNGQLQGEVLNSEREVYKEATVQHHCLYTHYFEQIANYSYIALRINYPERVTVGLRYDIDNKEFKLEQMHTYRNGCPSGKVYNMIKNYVEKEKDRWSKLCKNKIKEDFLYYPLW